MQGRIRSAGAGALALIGLVVAGPVLAAEPPTLDQLVGFFDSVALQDDRTIYGSAGTEPKPVSRWEGPMRVHFAGALSPGMIDRLSWHLERFQLLSGVDVQRVAQRSEANLRIVMTTSAEIAQLSGASNTLCLTEYGPPEGALEYADIFIPVGESQWLDNCMAHELMHAVGFYAHPKDNGNRSILEQGAPARMRTFSALDAGAIRMLYDSRLRIALPRDRALPIARAMAVELLADWPTDAMHPEPGDALGPGGFLMPEPRDGDHLAADPPRDSR